MLIMLSLCITLYSNFCGYIYVCNVQLSLVLERSGLLNGMIDFD